MGFVCHQQEKARNKTRREGKVDKVLCPQIIISREQTVNKFTQRREPFVASSSEQLQVFFSTFYRMMGERAFLKYALSKRATMNPSTWLLAESMEVCYAPTPLSCGSTARKVQKPFQVAIWQAFGSSDNMYLSSFYKYVLPSTKPNRAEVWPRFQSLLKRLLLLFN